MQLGMRRLNVFYMYLCILYSPRELVYCVLVNIYHHSYKKNSFLYLLLFFNYLSFLINAHFFF